MYESPKCHPRIKDSELSYILQNQETDLSQKNGILTSLPFVFQVVLTSTGSCIAKWLNSNNYVGVDKVRKWFNFLYCLGYSICLLGVIYSGCERMLSTVLSIAAMSFIGLSFNGCMITPVDMSPTFAGTLMGLSNTISSVAAFIFPVIVGIMTNEEQTLEQWNKIFLMCIGLTMSSGIFFCIFGSADVQPWNYSNEETKKRIFELLYNDEDDILRKSTSKRSKTIKSNFDLDLGNDGEEKKSISPYSINLGKGVIMELEKFHGSYYIGLSKSTEGTMEIRFRFNVPLAQLEMLKKGSEAMLAYVKPFFTSETLPSYCIGEK
ncbi:vesicular glutamate transporter 2 [Trichonephila inaurata madagascariensis]|uniref:Vesicular glutamate transporter 2 n=1 Tax=Trichonephila inaurata madagascariensis TaxID=2747483 RepID=A0A8X7BVJ5_9ARAC|nr:vesicular glutamate transporter 2 [Trichonephila inaurata madagascariensis]